jgi:5-methyltetrahydrofolate--homocysteine methyltransferase
MFLPQVVKCKGNEKQWLILPFYARSFRRQKREWKNPYGDCEGDVELKIMLAVVLACNYEIVDLGYLRAHYSSCNRTQCRYQFGTIEVTSLDEMVYLAKELDKQNIKIQMIGGATTSRLTR